MLPRRPWLELQMRFDRLKRREFIAAQNVAAFGAGVFVRFVGTALGAATGALLTAIAIDTMGFDGDRLCSDGMPDLQKYITQEVLGQRGVAHDAPEFHTFGLALGFVTVLATDGARTKRLSVSH
jgi:hypothetical protein